MIPVLTCFHHVDIVRPSSMLFVGFEIPEQEHQDWRLRFSIKQSWFLTPRRNPMTGGLRSVSNMSQRALLLPKFHKGWSWERTLCGKHEEHGKCYTFDGIFLVPITTHFEPIHKATASGKVTTFPSTLERSFPSHKTVRYLLRICLYIWESLYKILYLW